MRNDKAEPLMRGTLDLLILSTLSLEPKHGLAISRRIAQITSGTLEVKAGSLFPALHRLEQADWIEEAPAQPGSHGRAKCYRLTPAGRKQLKIATERWGRITTAVAQVLQTSS